MHIYSVKSLWGLIASLAGEFWRACAAFSASADSSMHIYAKFPGMESLSVPVQLLEGRRINVCIFTQLLAMELRRACAAFTGAAD